MHILAFINKIRRTLIMNYFFSTSARVMLLIQLLYQHSCLKNIGICIYNKRIYSSKHEFDKSWQNSGNSQKKFLKIFIKF